MATKQGTATAEALKQYNTSTNSAWDFGTNWSNVGKEEFETFVNKFLFPKLNQTNVISTALGNRFDWLAKEVDFIGQFSEEYVILDSVPVSMNLGKSEMLMLQRNYPKMATKLYNAGQVKKQKFTLNNNDTRLNFSTLGDATNYALAVYRKALSNINVEEEREIKGMLVDYALNKTANKRPVTSEEDLFKKLFEAVLNIQNNSEKYNEASLASNGTIGRYTTVSRLDKLMILTTDAMKTYLLDTKLANTFQVAGLDLSKKIISFDDLGGTFKLTADVTVAQADVDLFRTFGDYQIAVGDILPEGSVITFDISGLASFSDKFVEIKPESNLFAYVFDIDKLRYKRSTKGMLKEPFINPEFDEVTHWLHYYSFKAMSPFYNSVLIGG